MPEETQTTEAPVTTEQPVTTETAEPSWLDAFPEEARKDSTITRYKTPDELYKAIKNKDEAISRKGVIIPTDKSTPEEWNKYYNELGRPAKLEDYKFSPLPGDLHKNVQFSQEADKSFKQFAHENGYTNKQADQMNQFAARWLSNAEKAYEQRQEEATQRTQTALRQEWGEKYMANEKMVINGVLKAGGQEMVDAMGGEKGLGNNPVVLKGLQKIFSLVSEDQLNALPRGGHPTVSGNETKEEAQNKIKEMDSIDPKINPLWLGGHKDHDTAVAERTRLYRIVHGGEG